MKKTTLFTKTGLFVSCLCFIGSIHAQSNDKNTYVKIKTVKITNGDSISTVEQYSGDEAIEYLKNHPTPGTISNSYHYKIDEEDNNTSSEKKIVNKKVIVIKNINETHDTDDENTVEAIIEKHFSYSDQDGASFDDQSSVSITVDENRIVYTDENGEEKIIELDEIIDDEKKIIVIDKSSSVKNKKKGADDKKVSKKIKSVTSHNTDVDIYPNPNNGVFTIALHLKNKGKATINIVDMNGKQVYKKTLKGDGLQKIEVDLENQNPGIYMIQVDQDGEQLLKKVVLE